MINFVGYPLSAIFLVSLVVILAASEIGRCLGVRASTRSGDSHSTLEAAIMGLLALMISFTFAMALTRFDARRDALINEANAITTTALRARLLPAPHGTESLKLLRDYVQLRIDYTEKIASPQESNAAIVRSTLVQEALWQQARAAAVKDNGMVPTGLYIQTLNEMIDDQEARLNAVRNHVPNAVLLALYGIAAIASGFSGYGVGFAHRQSRSLYSRLPVYTMGVLICAVILLIQDLDRAGEGLITVSPQAMIDAAATIAGYVD